MSPAFRSQVENWFSPAFNFCWRKFGKGNWYAESDRVSLPLFFWQIYSQIVYSQIVSCWTFCWYTNVFLSNLLLPLLLEELPQSDPAPHCRRGIWWKNVSKVSRTKSYKLISATNTRPLHFAQLISNHQGISKFSCWLLMSSWMYKKPLRHHDF